MLYNYDNAALRILLWHDEYNRCKEELEKFKESSDGIIGSFPKLRNWGYWRAVFAEETDQNEPKETLIGAEFYEDDFWERVEENLRNQIDKLVPAIKAFSAKGQLTDSP